MGYPHVEQSDRDVLDDLGLVDDDRTEDLRPTKNAPEGAPTPSRALRNRQPSSHHNHTTKESQE